MQCHQRLTDSSHLLFQHGGQETTALTTIPFFAHQGIIFVPIGFARKELSTETHVVGGSAYGASSVACVTVCYLSQAPTVSLANSHLMTISGGTGGLAVLDEDKAVATYQGENFATIVETFLLGKAAIAAK
jgi:NAD(P)H dehydrogenase (quinone)